MKTWALAIFTLKETFRSKAMIAGLVISLFYLAVIPALSSAGGGGAISAEAGMKGNAGPDFLHFALGGLNFIGMIMAIFTTLGCIHSDVENGVMSTIITKPLDRRQVIIGKWAGQVLLMTTYVLVIGFALWLSVTVDSGEAFWSFLPAIALVCLNVATMVTLTITFSVFMPVAANAVFVFSIFAGASNLRIVNAISSASSNILATVMANLLRMMLPVGEVSDQTGDLLRGKTAAPAPTETVVFIPRAWSFAYEAVYILALILLAAMLFRKKDLK